MDLVSLLHERISEFNNACRTNLNAEIEITDRNLKVKIISDKYGRPTFQFNFIDGSNVDIMAARAAYQRVLESLGLREYVIAGSKRYFSYLMRDRGNVEGYVTSQRFSINEFDKPDGLKAAKAFFVFYLANKSKATDS